VGPYRRINLIGNDLSSSRTPWRFAGPSGQEYPGEFHQVANVLPDGK
jgi:hypothetical protein